MQIGFTQDLKPQFIKQMALLMSICYLLNPLQNQINMVLHEISHGLELPNSVLSHKAHLTETTYDNHVIHAHDNSYFEHEHEHPLVDFVNSIFEASNKENNSDNSQLVEVKWDKHITAYKFKLPIHYKIKVSKRFYSFEKQLKTRHSKRLKEPPQNLLS